MATAIGEGCGGPGLPAHGYDHVVRLPIHSNPIKRTARGSNVRRIDCVVHNRRNTLSLAQGAWLKAHENMVITGQTATAKTRLACAFGRQAARLDHSILYLRMPRLFEDLSLARLDGRFPRLVDKLARVQLLILDDWGTHTLTDRQRLDLLEIFEERYRRKSTLITAQLPVAQWHDMIGEPSIADAILDRII
jgi:DNA replication protein DnaC